MARATGHDDVRKLARQYSDRAMAVLAAIMNDEAAPPKARAMAATSILLWNGGTQRQPSIMKGAGEPAQTAVGVEWSGAPRED